MKPKIYRLTHQDWETQYDFDFIHPAYNKTDEQFKKDVQSLMKKYGDEYLAQEKSWAGTDQFIKFIAPKLKELDYELITPAITYTFECGCIIRERFINKEHSTDNEKEIINVMGEEFIRKCIRKNIDIELEMYKDNEELLKTINKDFKI